MSEKVVSLKNGLPITEIGGKAHSLSVLLSNSFNVPPGFVITSPAFFDFLKCNGLFEEIQRLALEITQDNFREKSTQAREAILKGEIPESIASEIDGFLNNLGAKYVSIRSSAVSEDSLKSSFAGLFDTFLNIRAELPLVLENVKRCWASLFNERAVAYRIRKGILHLEGMAVIIQEMIPTEASGITFTIHPTDQKSLLIETSYGLGDMIVSGRIQPDEYVVDRQTLRIIEKKIGRKSRISSIDGGEIKIVNTGKELAKRQVLPDDKVREIAEISLKSEKILNYPQDIEWCISNDKLWLLQSRPITR